VTTALAPTALGSGERRDEHSEMPMDPRPRRPAGLVEADAIPGIKCPIQAAEYDDRTTPAADLVSPARTVVSLPNPTFFYAAADAWSRRPLGAVVTALAVLASSARAGQRCGSSSVHRSDYTVTMCSTTPLGPSSRPLQVRSQPPRHRRTTPAHQATTPAGYAHTTDDNRGPDDATTPADEYGVSRSGRTPALSPPRRSVLRPGRGISLARVPLFIVVLPARSLLPHTLPNLFFWFSSGLPSRHHSLTATPCLSRRCRAHSRRPVVLVAACTGRLFFAFVALSALSPGYFRPRS